MACDNQMVHKYERRAITPTSLPSVFLMNRNRAFGHKIIVNVPYATFFPQISLVIYIKRWPEL